MARNKKLSVEVDKLLSTVEVDGDLGPKDAGGIARICAKFEMLATPDEIDVKRFHARVKRALDKLDAEPKLERLVTSTVERLSNPGSLPYFEEDMQLTGFFEEIGALLFFQVNLDEARLTELVDVFGQLLEHRRRRGQFKEAFLQSYRKEMPRVGALPFVSTAISMMNLQHLVEK